MHIEGIGTKAYSYNPEDLHKNFDQDGRLLSQSIIVFAEDGEEIMVEVDFINNIIKITKEDR